jgi:hypothetical protein
VKLARWVIGREVTLGEVMLGEVLAVYLLYLLALV